MNQNDTPTKYAQVWRDPRPTCDGGVMYLYAVSTARGNAYDIRESDLAAVVASYRRAGYTVQLGPHVPTC